MNKQTKQQIQAVSVTKYIVVFAGVYGGLIIAVKVLFHLAEIDLQMLGWCAVFAAGLATMAYFVGDNRRLPIQSERRKLVWFSVLTSAVVSLTVGCLVISLTESQRVIDKLVRELYQTPGAVWIALALGMVTVEYIVFGLIYSLGARYYLELLRKTDT